MGEKLKESGWFEIFRAGTWNGREYKKDDIDAMVSNFSVSGEPALFIGHNDIFQGERPAMGWVSALKRSGNKLMAKARNVSQFLVEAVNDEIFPNRSIEMWSDPKKGLTLLGVAFLGSSPPAVENMERFLFSRQADANGDFPIHAQEKDGKVYFAFRSVEKMVAGDSGQGVLQHKKSEVESMTKEEMDAAIAKAVAEAHEKFKADPEIVALKASNDTLKAQLVDTQNHAAAAAVKVDLDNCLAFAKKLVDDKKVTPAQFNGGLGGFLASLDNSEELQFGKDKKQTRRAFAMEMFGALPGKGSLFSQVDGDASRAGEDDNISAEVLAFAAKNGLDAKIVAKNFALARKNAGAIGGGDEDDGMTAGVGVSLV